MVNFPISLDSDTDLPIVNNNITEIGADAINALRDVAFAMEQNIGIGAAGTTASLADRLGVAHLPDGTLKPSALTSLGLVTLPITNSQIINNAGIPESKLTLDHRTQDLFNYISDLSGDINISLGWISSTGMKLEPHLMGFLYRHNLNQIDVSADPIEFLKNNANVLRNNSDSYQLINDINNEFLIHQFADGSPLVGSHTITTRNGSTYKSDYGHTASGIFLNTSRFSTIPQTAQDMQLFAEFIDSASIFLLGTRIQNLYTNGISRISRSSSLSLDGYGFPIIPVTTVTAYLLNNGLSSSPVDDIFNGDDIIRFFPGSSASNPPNSFDAQFAQVKVGDILRINYGTVEVQFVIKEKKYDQPNKLFVVRIAGKNLLYTTTATARIDRPLFNNNKPGVLALAGANNAFSQQPSLIVGNPRGAMTLGSGFNADLLDSTHYLLYLALYPTGNPVDGYTILPAIDVTGNRGLTPGTYTLDSVIEATNNAFRQKGYNYRFIAFAYQGDFGIMLADSYYNTGFSILNALVSTSGSFDSTGTAIEFPNNVIGMFATSPLVAPDPLGLGPSGSNVASPPFMLSYASPESSQLPTKLYLPLKRNNYYVNGVEKEKLNLQPFQVLDGYGDGYWVATITSRTLPGARVETTYSIPLDLSTSDLKIGKTLVVQSLGVGGLVDFGRFIIKNINLTCPPIGSNTDITVYDAVHATGSSPASSLGVGKKVAIYFDSDSISFNKENSTDLGTVSSFKRYFEVYIDQNAYTFTHERGRININGSSLNVNGVLLYSDTESSKLNIVKISPKLRGFQFGSVNKITLHMLDYSNTTGIFTSQLASFDGSVYTNKGPIISGKKGEIVRLYDASNIDYIDIIFSLDIAVASHSNVNLDIQLFPTLSLDEELMLIGTCQVNDTTNIVNYIRDERQFGNTSEKDLSTSALNLISLPEKLLHTNGIVRGFDLKDTNADPNPNTNQIYMNGGAILVNGKIISVNDETISIPIIKESFSSTLYNINWAVCINDKGEYQPIPLLDATTSTPATVNRTFKAYNPATAATYFIDATTFVDLIELRKDLTLLYIVFAQVNESASPATSTLIVTDARKYINDGESSFPLVLTSDTTQGNFRSLTAVMSWLNNNPSFNTKVIVRGTHEIDAVQTFDFTTLQNQVTFEGDGGIFNINIDRGITIGSFIKFKNIHFVHKFTPPTLSSSDFVNNDHGVIFRRLLQGAKISDINIEDCKFTVNNSTGQKYSYININMADWDTAVTNLIIKNNKFEVQNANDFNAAVAIINSAPQTGANKIPALVNIFIEENICASEQIIILTTAKKSGLIIDPGLSFVNVKVAKNVCGSIGAIVTSSASGALIQPNNILVIENNDCKYIANLDETGKFFEMHNIGSNTTKVTNKTGNTVIRNNKCAFIHYGIQPYFGRATSLQILHNNLTSNIPFGTIHSLDYLKNFNYSDSDKRFAIYVSSTPTTASPSNVLIDGNKVTGNLTGYESYIRLCAGGSIINNYLENIAPAATITDGEYSAIIYDGKTDGIIANNYISRFAFSIYAYITSRFDVTIDPANFVQVTENIFDDFTTDGSNTTLVKDMFGADLTNYWRVERNKNQTGSISVRGLIGMHSGKLTGAFNRPVIITDVPDSGLVVSVTNNIDAIESNIEIDYSAAAAAVRHHLWLVYLRDILPANVNIISLTSSAFSDVTASVANSKTKLTLTYNATTVAVTGTDTVTYTSGYVPTTIMPISITPNTKFRTDDSGNASFLVKTDFGHSASATVNIRNIQIIYRW